MHFLPTAALWSHHCSFFCAQLYTILYRSPQALYHSRVAIEYVEQTFLILATAARLLCPSPSAARHVHFRIVSFSFLGFFFLSHFQFVLNELYSCQKSKKPFSAGRRAVLFAFVAPLSTFLTVLALRRIYKWERWSPKWNTQKIDFVTVTNNCDTDNRALFLYRQPYLL